jgi:hypothetical protein
MAPVGTLPSTKTFIKLVWGHHADNMKNFKGFSHSDVCCKTTGGSGSLLYGSGSLLYGSDALKCVA